jgi:predicted hydrocarbon binding protein/predicted amino acid-binding ACT domain protein
VSTPIPRRVFSLVKGKEGEKIYELCIIIKDVQGALAKTTRALSDANINIKTASLFYLPKQNGVGSWTCFVDVSKTEKDIPELKEELQRLDVVLDVRFKEPKPALFEVMHFPLLHGDTRAVVVPIGMFWTMWNGLENILTPSGLAAVLYDTGKKVGEYVAIRLGEMYNLRDTELVEAVIQANQATGWAIAEVKNLDFRQPSGTVILHNCFEAAAWRKKSQKACHWTRGYIAGVMSKAAGKPVEAMEVKCSATGDDCCEFHIKEKI